MKQFFMREKKLSRMKFVKSKVHKSKGRTLFVFMFSPPKISWVVSGIKKNICLHLLHVFYLIQPSSKRFICFDFRKQNSVLPIVFYVPWSKVNISVESKMYLSLISISFIEVIIRMYGKSKFFAVLHRPK